MKYQIHDFYSFPKKKQGVKIVSISNDEDKHTIIEYLAKKVNSYELKPFTEDNSVIGASASKNKIAFYAQSDTLANSVLTIIKAFETKNYIIFTPRVKDEGAAVFFKKTNIEFTEYSFNKLKKNSPDVFVVFNDWSKEARRIIAQCRVLKLPTICIQESIIDFGDSFRRMQHADYAFLQGIHTSVEVNHGHCFITGNPRYENYKIHEENTINNSILINSNFTYGIFEEIRDEWLQSITQVLIRLNEEYLICQHPRDNANLIKYGNVVNSNSQSIPELLSKSKLLITRFSSLIHEALLMGKPVIYFNPHGEKMQYDFEFNDKFLFHAKTTNELISMLEYIKNNPIDYSEIERYNTIHCLPLHSKPSKNIASILQKNKLTPDYFRFKDFLILIFFQSWIVDLYDKVLKILKLR